MFPISEWYSSLGEYSFPTSFLKLSPEEITALLKKDHKSSIGTELNRRIRLGLKSFPGGIFVATDICAPTDSPKFVYGRGVWSVKAARSLLSSSPQVTHAFKEGQTMTLIFRPARRMSKAREFRLFIYQKKLVAMSQYHLDRHYACLTKMKQQLWEGACHFIESMKTKLPVDNLVMDVYFTSSKRFILIDLNEWNQRTDPKLLRSWDRNWEEEVGIKLISKPVNMKGEISVSF